MCVGHGQNSVCLAYGHDVDKIVQFVGGVAAMIYKVSSIPSAGFRPPTVVCTVVQVTS